MDDKKILENLTDMNEFLEAAGIGSKSKEDHFERMIRIAFASAIEKINMVAGTREEQTPDLNSLDDFFDYYTRFMDRDTINKIIQEEAQKVFKGYFNAISENVLKKA